MLNKPKTLHFTTGLRPMKNECTNAAIIVLYVNMHYTTSERKEFFQTSRKMTKSHYMTPNIRLSERKTLNKTLVDVKTALEDTESRKEA